MDGLLIGRFQPFHLGHLAAVRFALSMVDRLWLGIGSSNQPMSRENPFTADERQEMIASSLDPSSASKTRIFLVPDVDDHQRWIRIIDDAVSSYEIVFTTDRNTAELYLERGTKVVRIPLTDREHLSGTVVRALVLEGRRWKHLVPNGTWEVMQRIGARDRLARL